MVAASSQYASDLDAATQRLLARGARLTELLKQDQYTPMPVEEQVVVIFAGVRGFLDDIPLDKVTSFERKLRDELQANGQEILTAIRTEKEISAASEEKLKAFLENFTKTFV